MSSPKVPQDFVEAVAWRPTERLEFLLYGVRQTAGAQLEEPDLQSWPLGTEIHYSALTGKSWPVVVDLFEIRSPALPTDLEVALKVALAQLASQGSTLSWLMFEGAFGDIGKLFTPWQATQTYGVASITMQPAVRLRQDDRADPEWLTLLQHAVTQLYSAWPELRRLV